MNLMESGWNIEKPFLNDNIRASSPGLVVKAENPHYGDHFSGTIHLDQSLEQKLWKTLTWHC